MENVNSNLIEEKNTETGINKSQKPFPNGAFYAISILFGPLAAGIIGYKSHIELGMQKTAKIILKTSIIFSIIVLLVSLSGMKGVAGIIVFGNIIFCGIIGKSQSKAITRWENENPNREYGSILSCLKYGALGGILYYLPIIILISYQYIQYKNACPEGQELIGEYCYDSATIKQLKESYEN